MASIQHKQAGFSIMRLLVTLVAIGMIGAAGWFVYRYNRPKAASATANTQTTNQQSANTTPAATVSYLDIKEWGVKLPLSDAIKDAYYVVLADTTNNPDGKPSDIQLGLTSLNTNCGSVTTSPASFGHSLGAIVRTLPTDIDPVSGKLYTELEPNGVTINGYYYGYANASAKNKTCIPSTAVQSIDSALAAAAKSIVPETATAN